MIKNKTITSFIFTGFFFCLVTGYSQESFVDLYTRFYNITEIGRFSDLQVNDLYQDDDGFVWVGTDDGLFRYDGHGFFGYHPVEGDTLSISSNIINTIAGDNHGGMWIGTDNGLNYYDRKNEQFIRFMYDPDNPASIRNNHIRKLFPENSGLMLVETLDGTLTIFDRNGEKTRHFDHDPVRQPYYRYHALYQEENGKIWLGGRSLGLHRIDPVTGIIQRYSADPSRSDRKRENDISLVHVGEDGQWYVAGLDGFYKFFPGTGDFERILGTTSYYAVSDMDGNVWIGTGYGLVRYNNESNSLRHFRHNQDIPWSLSSNRVNVVMADRDGNIWTGTDDGLSFLSFRNSRFSNYTSITGESGSLSSGNITALIEDVNGSLWAGTSDGGLNLWDEESGEFIRFNADRGDLAADNVSALYEDSRGDIWIGLWAGAGFNKYNPGTGKFSHYAIDHNSMSRDWYNDFYEDPGGEFWLGVWGARGLMGFERDKGSFSTESYTAAHIPNRFDIADAIVYDDYIFISDHSTRRISRYGISKQSFISAVSNGSIVAPNQEDLLLPVLPGESGPILDMEKTGEDSFVAAAENHIISLNKKFEVLDFTESDTIISLCFSESSGRLNVLHPSGISVFNKDLERIGFLDLPVRFYRGAEIVTGYRGNIYLKQAGNVYNINISNSNFSQLDLPDEDLKGIISMDNGTFILSGNRVLKIADHECIFVAELSGSNDPVVTDRGIKSVVKRNGNKIILLFNNGAARSIDVNTGNLATIEMPGFSDDMLSLLSFAIPVEESSLLVASGTDIYLIDTSSGDMELINGPDSRSLTSHLVTAVIGEDNGTMWVGTSDGGLNRISACRERIDHFLPGRNNGGLAGVNVTSLFFDVDSNLWIGTTSGISVRDRVTGKMEPVGDDWGINNISSIIQDDAGRMWIGTERGLIRFCPVSGDWRLFSESDGLPSAVFNRAAVKRRDGTLVFGTRNGMTVIKPDNFNDDTDAVNVSISFFEVLGERMRSHFHQHDTVLIDHKSNYITIGYSTMNYHHPPLTTFYYRMEGLSDSWMRSTGNTANFTSLPPGTYRFQASRDREGRYDPSNSSLTIIVKPPFHQTLWFRLSLFVIIAGGIATVFAIYINQLKLKHKSARFEQKLLLSQMNPHFVFNSLSAIQSFIYTNDASEASDYLSDFSRLMRLILENSRSEEVTLSREIQALKLYFRLQKLRFFEKFDYEIILDPGMVSQRVMIPPMLIQPFIENSIEHGILRKKDKGFISLEIEMKDDHILAIITDDGVGLARAREINAGRNKNHHSLATSITNERLLNLYKRTGRTAGFEIIDRHDTEGVAGTRVVLKIPYILKTAFRDNGVNDIIFREDRE